MSQGQKALVSQWRGAHAVGGRRRHMQALEDFLRTHDTGDLLDIACGGGAFTRRVLDGSKSHGHVTGLDINADVGVGFLSNIDGDDVTFVASPIAAYLDGGHAFDTVSVSNALHHLEGVGDILRDVRGVVRPDGVVIIHEMYADGLNPPQETQRDIHAMIAQLHRVQGEYHRAAYTRQEILDFLDGAGLTVRHRFEALNDDAPVEKGTDGFAGRVIQTLAAAYPDGPPDDLRAECDALVARAVDVGVGRPPQWTFVCAYDA
jgi:ubiquinone/menaquinone biosynthesis C-methylase UbiE